MFITPFGLRIILQSNYIIFGGLCRLGGLVGGYEEFELIDETEVSDYLSQLEKQYAIGFDLAVKTSLISHCRDRQSGGLGNFIEIIELLFSQIRPEWEAISNQIIKETGRVLHTHSEAVQSYTSIKPSKYDNTEIESFEEMQIAEKAVTASMTNSTEYIDVSTLEPIRVDMATLQDVIRHKMGM